MRQLQRADHLTIKQDMDETGVRAGHLFSGDFTREEPRAMISDWIAYILGRPREAVPKAVRPLSTERSFTLLWMEPKVVSKMGSHFEPTWESSCLTSFVSQLVTSTPSH